jgi:hypothetical protein
LQFGHVGTMRGAHLASIGWRNQNEALPRRVMAGLGSFRGGFINARVAAFILHQLVHPSP